MSVLLHVAPHPDDEVLGAGATLALLRRHGWRVHNLACTLGRPADHDRRLSELTEATQRAGITNSIMSPLAELSSSDDLEKGAAAVAHAVSEAIQETSATLVVSPHPHDGHHGHEAVGRGVRDALVRHPGATWWMWGFWADLPVPTLFVPFGRDVLNTVMHAIAAYTGEIDRNSYDVLYPCRATVSAVLGSERVFGFGSHRSSDLPYAELFTETRYEVQSGWRLGPPRLLDPQSPQVILPPDGPDLGSWLYAPSVTRT